MATFSAGIKRIKASSLDEAKSIVRKDPSADYCFFSEKIGLVISSQGGELLGESVRDSLKEKNFLYLFQTKTSSYLVLVKDSLVVLDAITAVDSWRLPLLPFSDQDWSGVSIYCSGAIQDELSDFLKVSDNIKIRVLNGNHIEKVKAQYQLSSRSSFLRAKGSSSLGTKLVVGAVALSVLLYFYSSFEDDTPPPDPWASYKMEVALPTIGGAMSDALHKVVQAGSEIKSWRPKIIRITPEGIQITMAPVFATSQLSDVVSYAKKVGAFLNFSGSDVVLIFNLPSSEFFSDKKMEVMKTAVTLKDVIQKNTMFDVSYNTLVNKGNYSSLDASIRAQEVGLDEIYFIADILGKFPVFVNEVTLNASDDLDFIFSFDAKAKVIGG